MPTHVAIVDRAAAAALASGRKSIESRFSTHRRAPWGRVRPGDRIVFKLSGGGIFGWCRAARVRYLSRLTPGALARLRARLGSRICASRQYWRSRRGKRFGVLIWLSRWRRDSPPIQVTRQYGGAWITFD